MTVVERRAGPRRWVAVPAPAPDGSPRLVLASARPGGRRDACSPTPRRWLAVAALLGAVGVGVGGVGRDAGGAAPGRPDARGGRGGGPRASACRCPPPRDELRALAEEINALLARRDDAVGPARALHRRRRARAALPGRGASAPRPRSPWRTRTRQLDGRDVRGRSREAARLSDLLADLLALARADAGERPPPRPVDLVAAAGEALARGTEPARGPVLELVAPAPAAVAATPAEVAIVLDNLLANARRHAGIVVRVAVLPAGR